MNELQGVVRTKLQEVLNARFSDNKTKRTITTNYKGDELICACPICGDSAKDIFKKRMHIYTDSMAVKCYNCNFWGSVRQMFKQCSFPLDKKLGSVLDSVFDENMKQRVDNQANTGLTMFNRSDIGDKIANAKSKLFQIAVPVRYLLDKGFGALHENLVFTKYMMDRGYAFMTPAYKMMIVADTVKQGPAQLNAITDVNGDMRVLGTSTRIIEEGASQRYYFRYLTSLSPRVTTDMKAVLDAYRVYVTAHNILNVNLGNVITCCEGFFDAAFIENSISTGGTGNMGGLISLFKDNPENIRFLLDDDETGNQMRMSLIRKGFSVFSWQQYKEWAMHDLGLDLSKCKDVTDVVKIAMHHGEDTTRLCIDTMQKPNMYISSALEAMKDMLMR